jgi:hypothetical protein
MNIEMFGGVSGRQAEHAFVVPGHRFQFGLIVWVKWLPLLPGTCMIRRHNPKVSIRVQHNPLLAGSIDKQIHHILP